MGLDASDLAFLHARWVLEPLRYLLTLRVLQITEPVLEWLSSY